MTNARRVSIGFPEAPSGRCYVGLHSLSDWRRAKPRTASAWGFCMSCYVRVEVSFWNHRKTLRLRAAIGDAAYWVPPRLWCYAATNQQNGDFTRYSAQEIAFAVGYNDDPETLLKALLASGFMDKGPKLHDWSEYNGVHNMLANRARKAAKARWSKSSIKTEESTGEYSTGEVKHTASMQQASDKHERNGIDEEKDHEW